MGDAFNDRERGFESKYKQDQEFEFKVIARRNKLVGLWLATEFGIVGEAAETYAKEVVVADLEEPGDEAVIRKVMADIQAQSVTISDAQVWAKLTEMETKARQQLLND